MPIAIRTLRLDDEVDSGFLKAPQFIKIDIEGHAHKALEGMRQSVSRSRPRLFIAFHSPDEVEGVLAILKPLGYRWSVIGTPPPNPETLIGGDYSFTPSRTS